MCYIFKKCIGREHNYKIKLARHRVQIEGVTVREAAVGEVGAQVILMREVSANLAHKAELPSLKNLPYLNIVIGSGS